MPATALSTIVRMAIVARGASRGGLLAERDALSERGVMILVGILAVRRRPVRPFGRDFTALVGAGRCDLLRIL
jgi:hypothetical protein